MNRWALFALMPVALVLHGVALPAKADLIGTSVSGQMQIASFGTENFFDPANGLVPAGFGNSTSPNNVVIGAETEFAFMDPSNTDTVDFSSTSLTLQDVTDNGVSRAVTYIFTDTAFLGASLSQGTDSFPNLVTANLTGDVLTLTMPEEHIVTFNATWQDVVNINLVQTPEPSSFPLLALGLAGLGFCERKRVLGLYFTAGPPNTGQAP